MFIKLVVLSAGFAVVCSRTYDFVRVSVPHVGEVSFTSPGYPSRYGAGEEKTVHYLVGAFMNNVIEFDVVGYDIHTFDDVTFTEILPGYGQVTFQKSHRWFPGTKIRSRTNQVLVTFTIKPQHAANGGFRITAVAAPAV